MAHATAHQRALHIAAAERTDFALNLNSPFSWQPATPIGTLNVFNGTPGDDGFAGTKHDDIFNMADGGHDTVLGQKGNDTFNFGAKFDRKDSIDGGKGTDTLFLDGDYSGDRAVTFKNSTLKAVESVDLAGGHSYELILAAGTLGDAGSITVSGFDLLAGDQMTVIASALTGPAYLIGGAGDDFLTGGTGGDVIDLPRGGQDTAHGGGGDDAIVMGASLTAADTLDGGANTDAVSLNGDYSGANAVVFGAATMVGVETLALAGGSFTLTTNDANVAASTFLVVDASALGAADMLTLDGSAELDGKFDVTAGAGQAVLKGGAGFDIFRLGANFTADDRVNGGGSIFDQIFLDGDYSAGVLCGADTMRGIDQINLAPGHSYSLTLDNANLAFSESLRLEATFLGAADQIFFDGSDELSAAFVIYGGAANDTFIGGDGADFISPGGGFDVVKGGDGDDVLAPFESFSPFDSFDGGAGNDRLELSGDFSAGVTFNFASLVDIETLLLEFGNFNITLIDANVPFGHTLDVVTFHADALVFDASAVTDGVLRITGTDAADTVTIGQSGHDIVRTGADDDIINVLGNLSEDVRIDGGAEFDVDTVAFNGDYSDRLQFNSHTIRNIEFITFHSGHDYNLAMADGNVASGQALVVSAAVLATGDNLIFDGSAESNGHFTIDSGDGQDSLAGGTGNDVLNGGGESDWLTGNGGADLLIPGAGADVFAYGGAGESTSLGHDTITAANLDADRFDVPGTVSAIDAAVVTGNLRDDTAAIFDSDMAVALSGHLGAQHAILFSPDAGDFIGHKFLIVDLNGVGGYQTGKDMVIDVTGSTGTLANTDFI